MATETDIVANSLVGIVDIGLNGIRFLILSVAPHHARTTPCVFKDRLNVSLFEAQYKSGSCTVAEKLPIPKDVIYEVCCAMRRFDIICSDFGVKSVRVVATEAIREAQNSEYFRNCVTQTTGWPVELLSKEQEGHTGLYGVVSSFHGVRGLFMDLGGGLAQISWIYTESDGSVSFSKKPVSFPYGAAALTRRLRTEDKRELFAEIKLNFARARAQLDIPQKLKDEAQKAGGFRLFCLGGGLRGFGHVLLAQKPDYPIPAVINGYAVSFDEVSALADYLLLKGELPEAESSVFRVSRRRKQQLPAVGLLLSAAFELLPKIRSVHFSEGGVREGALFETLPQELRAQDPLIVATSVYKPLLVDKYLALLRASLPKEKVPPEVYERVAPALCNLAFVHSLYPKELQPTAALHVATQGIIAGTHGLSHRIRALIGLALCERWGAELPTSEIKYRDSLVGVVERESNSGLAASADAGNVIFWTIYIGKIMFFICGIHPGGNISEDSAPFEFRVKVEDGEKPKFEAGVWVDPENVRIGLGAGSRIKSIQKKIKKLSKAYGVKLKFEIQETKGVGLQSLKHGERDEEEEEEEE